MIGHQLLFVIQLMTDVKEQPVLQSTEGTCKKRFQKCIAVLRVSIQPFSADSLACSYMPKKNWQHPMYIQTSFGHSFLFRSFSYSCIENLLGPHDTIFEWFLLQVPACSLPSGKRSTRSISQFASRLCHFVAETETARMQKTGRKKHVWSYHKMRQSSGVVSLLQQLLSIWNSLLWFFVSN